MENTGNKRRLRPSFFCVRVWSLEPGAWSLELGAACLAFFARRKMVISY